jgi:hypothetical protein
MTRTANSPQFAVYYLLNTGTNWRKRDHLCKRAPLRRISVKFWIISSGMDLQPVVAKVGVLNCYTKILANTIQMNLFH